MHNSDIHFAEHNRMLSVDTIGHGEAMLNLCHFSTSQLLSSGQAKTSKAPLTVKHSVADKMCHGRGTSAAMIEIQTENIYGGNRDGCFMFP